MMAMGFEADFGEMVCWQPSVQLRFVERQVAIEGSHMVGGACIMKRVKILQQLWTSNKGTREWRDVETQPENK